MNPKHKAQLIGALCLLTVFTSVNAVNAPRAHTRDKRILFVNYEDNNVVPIHGKTFTATQVVFGTDEVVLDIEGGDTTGWMVTHKPELANIVFIKPTMLGSNTNMTVVTNKHSYYFHLNSNNRLRDTSEAPPFAIRFAYPQERKQESRTRTSEALRAQKELINPAKNPEAYNWDYRFSGSNQLTPLHVFDDGTFTYFELAPNQATPAIFAVDDREGKEAVVNIRRSGNYLIVQRLAPQFSLRSGGVVTSVFNSREIARIKQGRRPS